MSQEPIYSMDMVLYRTENQNLKQVYDDILEFVSIMSTEKELPFSSMCSHVPAFGEPMGVHLLDT